MNQQHVEEYLRKSGDDSIVTYGRVESAEDKGFCIWSHDEDSFIVIQEYGDGQYWDTWAVNKARELGFKSIKAATKRSPKALCKKYGYRVAGYVIEKDV